MLLARLGLGAVEIARLRLDDIDWRGGELLVRGKDHRDERLPLPHDVGEAIVAYLRGARPADAWFREAFAADLATPASVDAGAVGGIVERGCHLAGLERFGDEDWCSQLADAALKRVTTRGTLSVVLHDVTALNFEADTQGPHEREVGEQDMRHGWMSRSEFKQRVFEPARDDSTLAGYLPPSHRALRGISGYPTDSRPDCG